MKSLKDRYETKYPKAAIPKLAAWGQRTIDTFQEGLRPFLKNNNFNYDSLESKVANISWQYPTHSREPMAIGIKMILVIFIATKL